MRVCSGSRSNPSCVSFTETSPSSPRSSIRSSSRRYSRGRGGGLPEVRDVLAERVNWSPRPSEARRWAAASASSASSPGMNRSTVARTKRKRGRCSRSVAFPDAHRIVPRSGSMRRRAYLTRSRPRWRSRARGRRQGCPPPRVPRPRLPSRKAGSSTQVAPPFTRSSLMPRLPVARCPSTIPAETPTQTGMADHAHDLALLVGSRRVRASTSSDRLSLSGAQPPGTTRASIMAAIDARPPARRRSPRGRASRAPSTCRARRS